VIIFFCLCFFFFFCLFVCFCVCVFFILWLIRGQHDGSHGFDSHGAEPKKKKKEERGSEDSRNKIIKKENGK
jgi:hypothetical protein